MTKEKEFQREFNKWLRHQDHIGTAVFELKLVKGPSMAFSRVEDHQIEALYHASRDFVVYKIPDDTIGQKPFDCFRIERADAYVVIKFLERGNKEFFMITIEDFVNEINTSHKKSITAGDALRIGERCVLA